MVFDTFEITKYRLCIEVQEEIEIHDSIINTHLLSYVDTIFVFNLYFYKLKIISYYR